MKIENKTELAEVIEYEKRLWIKRMYPHENLHKVKNRTLLYMKALRVMEYYGTKSKWIKICGGGVFFLESNILFYRCDDKCFYSPLCI